jgi:hypothetical protein
MKGWQDWLPGDSGAVPAADAQLFEWETLKPSQWTADELADAEYLGHRSCRGSREFVLMAERMYAAHSARQVKPRRWLPWLAAVLALGLWPGETGSLRTGSQSTVDESTNNEKGDEVSLGEAAACSPPDRATTSNEGAIAQELPNKSLPGQLKPDSKGRCPNKQIAINGGCWLKVDALPEECPGHGYTYQGGCYFPFYTSQREPAAAPQKH